MRSQLKSETGKISPHREFNHRPLEQKASVLPMSYTDSLKIILLKKYSWIKGGHGLLMLYLLLKF